MADKELKTTWVDNNITVTGSDEATNKLIAELIAKKLAEGKIKPPKHWELIKNFLKENY